jgi:hypothetical protein
MGRKPKTTGPTARDPGAFKSVLARINIEAGGAVQTIWGKNSNEDERKKQVSATIAGLIGINPSDELEGMLAAQLVGCHNASMGCYRRAMIGEQTFERPARKP